ncbi:pentapeptide repeat-containing protein [Streptomyces xanthophaeus]
MAFIGRVLTEATFTDCDLSDAVFTDCTLRLTEFGTGRYRNTDLRENDLSAMKTWAPSDRFPHITRPTVAHRRQAHAERICCTQQPSGAGEICCMRPIMSGATHSSATLSPSMR